jgi:hypothetical protein
MRALLYAVILVPALAPRAGWASTLTVGPGQEYATIAAAVAASRDGDVIDVTAATYTNDFAEISTQITLAAIGGRVTMKATQDLPNGKGILVTDTNISITGFTFEGARIPNSQGGNGAGIRYQGGSLVLTDCYFHGNQEGLLGDADPTGTITISNSEFASNGDKTGPNAGYTHNIYIGAIAVADIESSYFHDVNQGHEIKSRAVQTVINHTRVVDGPTGTASYSIDLPNGGLVSVTNDQIEQGPDSTNGVMISYGEEGSIIPGSVLTVSNTLIENDLTAHVPVGVANESGITASLDALNVYGLTSGELVNGPVTETDITYLATEPSISRKHPF